MNIRVGIHIGDIVFKDGDVFGGGVNVASRLESIAPAGGVCVSKSVYDELSNQDDFDGIELGLQSLKGVGRLIEVFGLKGDKLNEPNPDEYKDNKITVHSDDEVPSVAIIPFDNKGEDEDVFYAYGISVDLISDVTSAGLIRVASKKQIDEAGELPQDKLAKALDVRYMANGELWRMGDMFQLSVELYDTKDKKVVWSDRWQEKWDNLPAIKGNLSDGLLKALNIKPNFIRKPDTDNTKAYEFYLNAKYKWFKDGSGLDHIDPEEESEIRDLLKKSIKLDNNLLAAKILLGRTYYFEDLGSLKLTLKARNIFEEVLKSAKKLNDKLHIGLALRNIGITYFRIGDREKSNHYYLETLKIAKKIDDKDLIQKTYSNIGTYKSFNRAYDEALDYYSSALSICKEIDNKQDTYWALIQISQNFRRSGDFNNAIKTGKQTLSYLNKVNIESFYKIQCTYSIAKYYYTMGKYFESLNYSNQSYIQCQKSNNKHQMAHTCIDIALCYYQLGKYNKSIEYIKKVHLQDSEEFDWYNGHLILSLINKKQGNEIDEKIIDSFIKKEKSNFDVFDNYAIYQIIEDASYLEIAYEQLQGRIKQITKEFKPKFLSYPIPKAIVEEWEKVK